MPAAELTLPAQSANVQTPTSLELSFINAKERPSASHAPSDNLDFLTWSS